MDPATQRLGTERDAVLASLRERIVAFAASRLSRDVAEDLTQDVLLLIHEKYPEVERIEDLVPLCLRILRFKMMAFYRKAQRRGEQVPADEYPLPDGGPSPEVVAERKEIADRLGLSPGTVRWHLENIYGKLHVHSRTEAVLKFRSAKPA